MKVLHGAGSGVRPSCLPRRLCIQVWTSTLVHILFKGRAFGWHVNENQDAERRRHLRGWWLPGQLRGLREPRVGSSGGGAWWAVHTQVAWSLCLGSLQRLPADPWLTGSDFWAASWGGRAPLSPLPGEYNFKGERLGKGQGTHSCRIYSVLWSNSPKEERTSAQGGQTKAAHVWASTLLHTNPNGCDGIFLTFFVLLTKQLGHYARNWPFLIWKEMEKSPQHNVVIFLYCGKKNKRLLEDSLSQPQINQSPMLSDLSWANVLISRRFSFCCLWAWVGLWGGRGTHTHTCFVLDTGRVCSSMFKAQAEVTSLWNPHNNGDCYRSVVVFALKIFISCWDFCLIEEW